MPDATGRRAALLATFVVVAIVAGFGRPWPAAAHDPGGLDRFREAVGQVESGGRYDARNPTSGAYGKYQILPSNWPGWARKYVGDPRAPWSPRNQDLVARGKMHDLYHWLGSWRRVAYWWLTGSKEPNEARWSSFAKRYVAKIMAVYAATPETSPPASIVPAVRSFQETDASIAWAGPWRAAPFAAYAGRNARWTNARGAAVTFTFTGRTVAWFGPKGPTRGVARVFLDGVEARPVDLYATRFRPRNRIFAARFPAAGPHALVIVVAGTNGRPTVAIDEFVVTD